MRNPQEALGKLAPQLSASKLSDCQVTSNRSHQRQPCSPPHRVKLPNHNTVKMSDSESKSFTLQTASFDARFPNQNQTKHCWQK